MADDIITATEAEALNARIKRLLVAEPVLPSDGAERQPGLLKEIGRRIRFRSDRRLPSDQWFALCADTLRAILPEDSDARQQFETIAASLKHDGKIDAARVMEAAPRVKDLLRIAETTADLYTGTARPEDLDLRIREAIRRDVWQAWPVRALLLAVFALVGGTAFWGVTAVEGLKVDLRQELNTAERALRADIRKLSDETGGVIVKAREDLQAFKDEMTSIKGTAATELVDFQRILAEAKTNLAEQRGEIADRIVNSSERIATLYAQVRADLEGLDERTQASFERALNDRTSGINQSLEAFRERIAAMDRVADRAGAELVTLGERAGAIDKEFQALTQAIENHRGELVTVGAEIESLQNQKQGVAGRLDSLLSIYRETLELGRTSLSEANALLSSMRTLKDESATFHAAIGATKGSFDAEVETLRSEIGTTRNSVTEISGSAAALGQELDRARQGLETRMSSFDEAHGKAMPRLTKLTTDHLNPLETQASGLEDRFRVLEDRHRQIGNAMQGLAQEITDTGTSLSESSVGIKQTTAIASGLHNDVVAVRTTFEAGRADIENMKSRSADLKTQLAALEATRDGIKPGYEQLLRLLSEAISQTQAALGEAAPLVAEIRNARQTVVDLLNESGNDSRSIDGLAAVLTGRQAELVDRWAELDAEIGRQASLAIDTLENKRAQIEGLLEGLVASLVKQEPAIGPSATTPALATPIPDPHVAIGTK